MYGLTEKQNRFLKYLKSCRGSVKPSYEEIADALGYKSKNGVHLMMMALERRGKIRLLHGKSRSWEVLK